MATERAASPRGAAPTRVSRTDKSPLPALTNVPSTTAMFCFSLVQVGRNEYRAQRNAVICKTTIMPKRKCSFNITLQQKYPFIKQRKDGTADVTCEKCRTDFSVGHGGASDIEHHLKSEKHRLADQAAASSSSMFSFFKRTDLPTSKDLDIAAAEGT